MTSRDALAIGTDVKPPVLFKGEYEQWKDRFLDFLDRHENGEKILESITKGPMKTLMSETPSATDPTRMMLVPKALDLYSMDEKKRLKADKQAKSLLLQSIPNDIYIKMDSFKANAKTMWDQLEKMMMGSKAGHQMKVANCLNSYEEFKAKVGESLEETYDQFVLILNELSKNRVEKKQMEMNDKFLSVLQPEWKKHTRRMKKLKDLNDIPLHEVYETLRQNEEEVEEKREEKKKTEKPTEDPIALVVKEKKEKKKEKKKVISSDDDIRGSFDSDSDSDNGTKLMEAMILLTKSFQKKFYKKPGSNSQRYASGSKNYAHKERVEGRGYDERKYVKEKKFVNDYGDKKEEEAIKCYNCGKIGHFAKDCRKPKVKNVEYYKNKMLLAKQLEAGKALLAEDALWLDHSDVDEEKEEMVNMCLMGNDVKGADSDEEIVDSTEEI